MTTQQTQSTPEVQISFRASPETRKQARIAAAKADLSLNDWLKHLVETQVKAEQVQ